MRARGSSKMMFWPVCVDERRLERKKKQKKGLFIVFLAKGFCLFIISRRAHSEEKRQRLTEKNILASPFHALLFSHQSFLLLSI